MYRFSTLKYEILYYIYIYLQSAVISPNIANEAGEGGEYEEKIASNIVTRRFPVNAVNDELQNSFGNLYLAFKPFRPYRRLCSNSLHCHPRVHLSHTPIHPLREKARALTRSSHQAYRNL